MNHDQAQVQVVEALSDLAQAVAMAGRALTLEQALAEADAVLERDHHRDADAMRRTIVVSVP